MVNLQRKYTTSTQNIGMNAHHAEVTCLHNQAPRTIKQNDATKVELHTRGRVMLEVALWV